MQGSNRSGRVRAVALGAGLAIGALGCSEGDKSTELHPEGPPLITQVIVKEHIEGVDDDGNPFASDDARLAFGTHPDVSPQEDDSTVESALALTGPGQQRIRIVVDELLRGNNLEEIQCTDGSFSRVPLGTTPDDLVRCMGTDLRNCTGDHVVCAGVGILDSDSNGTVDQTQFIDGVVTLTCDDAAVPLALDRTYYQPSGNQLLPASQGLNGLGPAIVVAAGENLRPRSTCRIAFGADVVDKDGNQICAPPGGDLDGSCSPGDVSLISFQVEAFRFVGSEPANDAEGVDPGLPAVTVGFNASLQADTVNSTTFVVTAGDTPVPGATATLSEEDPTVVSVTFAGGMERSTTYTLTVAGGDTGLEDIFADSLAEAVTVSWTTSDGSDSPDAGPGPDAPTEDGGTEADAGEADVDAGVDAGI
jgi:Big-like domain-containing protein